MSRSKNKKARNPKATIQMKRLFYELHGELYVLEREENTMVTEERYKGFLGSAPSMKRDFHGKERMYRGFNSKGERVINKVISTSPNGQYKTYTYFIF